MDSHVITYCTDVGIQSKESHPGLQRASFVVIFLALKSWEDPPVLQGFVWRWWDILGDNIWAAQYCPVDDRCATSRHSELNWVTQNKRGSLKLTWPSPWSRQSCLCHGEQDQAVIYQYFRGQTLQVSNSTRQTPWCLLLLLFPMLLPPNFVPFHAFWQVFLLGWSLAGILGWSFFNHGAQQRVTRFGLWGKCGEMKPELKLAQELGSQGCFFRCQQGEWIGHNYLGNLRVQFRHMWCMKANLIGVIFLGRGS